MGNAQGVVEPGPEKKHEGDIIEFKRLVSEGASVHFASVAAGIERGWERDPDLRAAIDRINAANICKVEAAAFKDVSNGHGNATLAANFLRAKAGWNDKDDLPQEIVILPKVVDGRSPPPLDPRPQSAKAAL